MSERRLLIAGCGDLGIRLAQRLRGSDWAVQGLRRKIERLPPWLSSVAADLSRPDTLRALARERYEAVIYQATPGRRDPDAYRQAYVRGLANLLAVIKTDRFIFVSSTAVYGQDAGEWVDEDSATDPTAFNGRVLLEAEALARAVGGVVVRFSGIYGPGREALLSRLRSGQSTCREAPPQWTNRIHADDCAGVLAHLLALPEPAPVYCATDCEPATRCDVLDWLANRLALPNPPRDASLANGQGKRVDNRLLKASGYDFLFPDFRSGYGAMLP